MAARISGWYVTRAESTVGTMFLVQPGAIDICEQDQKTGDWEWKGVPHRRGVYMHNLRKGLFFVREDLLEQSLEKWKW